jgi:hypothetical protein
MQTKQIEDIKKVLSGLGFSESSYNVSIFNHDKIQEKYGEINLLQVPLKNSSGTDLLVFPGYSFNSFTTMFTKLVEGMKFFENKFRCLYMINFGDKVKADSKEVGKGLPESEAFILNDNFKEELVKVLDKCMRSPEVNLTNFTVLGKSAGGGVSVFFAGINKEVKRLLFCCPGITNKGTPLAGRPELEIDIGWNIDDDNIEYNINKDIMEQLTKQGNKAKFHGYQSGGHELNVQFLEDVFSK